jgi:hypothetical protein
MSFKRRIFAAAATITMVGAVGATGAMAAHAATPSAGPNAIDLYSRLFGTHAHPNFVFNVKGNAATSGAPIILWQASNSNQGEDFTISEQGTVNDFYLAGLVTASLNLHYHSLRAYEIQYSPYGNGTGLCIGVGSTAGDGTKVTLQSCGESSKTVWVVDSFSAIKGAYVPLINGSDTNFSNPYVLNYPDNGYPTDNPRPQLQTWTLQKFSSGTTVDQEMFSADFGVLP